MLIYIEGVDGSGKSTLATAIAKRLNELKDIYKIDCIPNAEDFINTNPNKPNRIDATELIAQLLKMSYDMDKVFICDRGPISDIIYRTFDEHKPIIDLLPLVMLLQKTPVAVIIYCNTEKSYELMTKRGDTNTVAIKQHKALKYLYSQIMPMLTPVYFDLARDNTDEAINLIIARLFIARGYYLKQVEEEN